jgi:hypothetical protein
MTPVAVGFRVKSGYAIAVALRGPASAPEAIVRLVVQLSDPDVAETRQPYHDGFYKIGLHCPDGEIRRTLATFGKTLGGTWRAEEKAASTAAWLALVH